MQLAIDDAAKRLLLPSIENDVRNTLSEIAERHAIQVFGVNLRAVDPGTAGWLCGDGHRSRLRTGCKAAVVDPSGKILATETIYPHPPQKQTNESLRTLAGLIQKHNVSLISIGLAALPARDQQLVATLLRNTQNKAGNAHYLITNEAGASVYSASPLARAEMPDLDVSMRSGLDCPPRAGSAGRAGED